MNFSLLSSTIFFDSQATREDFFFLKIFPFHRRSQFTPQVTPLQQIIEKVTDASQSDEDWDSIMKICDHVSMSDEHAKDALRVIRKRLQMNPAASGWRSIALTLTLIEALTKNCGKRFHVQIAQKDFLREFRAVLMPKNAPPTAIQEKILSLIQTWAVAFRDDPDLKTVEQFYQECKQQGVEFPPAEPDSIIKTSVSAKASVEPVANYNRSTSHPAGLMNPHLNRQQMNEHAVVRQITAEQVAKLRSELDVVQTNGQIFGEMLITLQPAEEHPQDFELLTELYKTCKQMQARIVDLLSQVSLDDITVDLLRYNDEFNNSFKTYESYIEERQRRLGLASPPLSISNPSGFSNIPVASASSSSRTNNEPALIKFDDESSNLTSAFNTLTMQPRSLDKDNSQHATAAVVTRPIPNEPKMFEQKKESEDHQPAMENVNHELSQISDTVLRASAPSTSQDTQSEVASSFGIPQPLANNPNA